MSDHNQFELYFKSFVESFGGTVLREAQDGKTADFLFSRYNVVAELKTLLVDSTPEMNKKVGQILGKWMTASSRLPTQTVEDGKFIFEMRSVEPEIAQEWINLLRQQVERLVKEANSQIADTKRRENLPSARGILLVSNTSNIYHNDPRGFRLILGNLLCKRTPEGSLRYPDIQGAVFFSAQGVKSLKENMYFWTPLQMKRSEDDDVSDIVSFQADLRDGWYRFITETTGIEVRQHFTD
jgi:hypothetical protein